MSALLDAARATLAVVTMGRTDAELADFVPLFCDNASPLYSAVVAAGADVAVDVAIHIADRAHLLRCLPELPALPADVMPVIVYDADGQRVLFFSRSQGEFVQLADGPEVGATTTATGNGSTFFDYLLGLLPADARASLGPVEIRRTDASADGLGYDVRVSDLRPVLLAVIASADAGTLRTTKKERKKLATKLREYLAELPCTPPKLSLVHAASHRRSLDGV